MNTKFTNSSSFCCCFVLFCSGGWNFFFLLVIFHLEVDGEQFFSSHPHCEKDSFHQQEKQSYWENLSDSCGWICGYSPKAYRSIRIFRCMPTFGSTSRTRCLTSPLLFFCTVIVELLILWMLQTNFTWWKFASRNYSFMLSDEKMLFCLFP